MALNEHEVKLLQDYVKKRYSEVDMDYQTFDGEIDDTLTYQENKNIITEYLDEILPKTLPKLKRECAMEKAQVEQMQKEMQKEIIDKAEKQAKLQFEQQLEKIANTPTSVLIDNLYFIPKSYIKMVLEKKSKGLLLYGSAGLGKSFQVKKALKEENLKEGLNFVFVCGHITPLSFYKKLYENQDKLVILDDINLLESKINLNMLKAVLSDGLVEYSSSALKDIPNQFYFKGNIIILLNEKPKNDENLKAVESRILTYHLEMDYETKMQILYDIAKLDYLNIEMKDRQEIAKWIKENTNQATKNLSIRLLFMCFEFYKFDKENWKILASSYIQNDEYITLILQGCSKQEFIEQTGLSGRTWERIRQTNGLSRGYHRLN